MKENIHLNETAIKRALENGYITGQEAREMLMVYVQKVNFNPMKHPSAHIQQAPRARHH